MNDPNATAYPTGASGDPGLTIREEFAKTILAGLLSDHSREGMSPDEIVTDAVDYADRLISKLNQTP